MGEIQFLKVDLSKSTLLNGDELIFLALLKFVSRKWQKDKCGYFRLDSSFITATTGMNRQKIRRVRAHLVKLRMVDYIPGSNQNQKPRYKLL